MDAAHGNDAGDARVLAPTITVVPPLAARQRALVAGFLASLGEEVAHGRRAPATWAAYRKNLRLWLRFCATQARTDDPTSGTVRAFAEHLAGSRRPASLNALLDAVRACYAWTAAQRLHPAIGAAVTWLPYDRAPVATQLTSTQALALSDLLPESGLRALRDRAILALLLEVGVATISLHRLDWGHCQLSPSADLATDTAAPCGTLVHQPQGHRRPDVRAGLTPTACHALAQYLSARGPVRATDPVFVRISRAGRPGGRLSTLSMRLLVLRLMERAGHARRDAAGRLVQPGVFSASCLRRSALGLSLEGLRPSNVRSASAARLDPARSRRRH